MEYYEKQGTEYTLDELSKLSKLTNDEVTVDELFKLVELSQLAKENSYSPYSKFRVACCLLTTEGKLIQGANVENLSYGLTICAERTAVCKAVSSGERSFRAAMITTDMDYYVSPCGACRQTLSEFNIKYCFLLKSTSTTTIQFFTVEHLLPSGVTIPHLKKQG